MNATEQIRHRTLVRQCCAWRVRYGAYWLREWLDGFRGDRERLKADIREQWERGNRGKPGEWKPTVSFHH